MATCAKKCFSQEEGLHLHHIVILGKPISDSIMQQWPQNTGFVVKRLTCEMKFPFLQPMASNRLFGLLYCSNVCILCFFCIFVFTVHGYFGIQMRKDQLTGSFARNCFGKWHQQKSKLLETDVKTNLNILNKRNKNPRQEKTVSFD